VEAVIDKDLASAVLAADLHVDELLIITDVDAVYADWGTPCQNAIRRSTPEDIMKSQFAEGSMGPKVKAACQFVERGGEFAAIGSIDDAPALLAGRGHHRDARPGRPRRGHWGRHYEGSRLVAHVGARSHHQLRSRSSARRRRTANGVGSACSGHATRSRPRTERTRMRRCVELTCLRGLNRTRSRGVGLDAAARVSGRERD
jgi:hypothetical protein